MESSRIGRKPPMKYKSIGLTEDLYKSLSGGDKVIKKLILININHTCPGGWTEKSSETHISVWLSKLIHSKMLNNDLVWSRLENEDCWKQIVPNIRVATTNQRWIPESAIVGKIGKMERIPNDSFSDRPIFDALAPMKVLKKGNAINAW